jgi:hypothetical protein
MRAILSSIKIVGGSDYYDLSKNVPYLIPVGDKGDPAVTGGATGDGSDLY